MASIEKLSDLFGDLGFDLQTNIVEKCLEYSVHYDIEPSDLVDIFVAYCVSHLNGAEPTLPVLDDFERKILQKESGRVKKASTTNQPQKQPVDLDDYGNIDDSDDDGENDVMSAYICTTPKAKEKKPSIAFNTPTQDGKANHFPNDSAMDSPILSGKDVSGKVVCTFGNAALVKSIAWSNNKKPTVTIERLPNTDTNSNHFTSEQDYMYDTMEQKANIAADRVFDIGQQICNKLIQDTTNDFTADLYDQIAHADVRDPATIKTIGRICCEGLEDKLQPNSTLLLGADEQRLRTVRLNFNRMKSFGKAYSLFPGQTVMVQGLNPRGEILYVDDIYTERILTHADVPKLTEDLHIVTASGPFTSNADLNYEPLTALLEYCKQHKPDVLILLGPFLDADHPLVQEGMNTAHDAYFENNLIARIVANVGPNTEILIVSSSRDVHSSAAYPTNPYSFTGKTPPHKNVTFLPDPSLVKINGITIAITATDTFNHILDTELTEFSGDKVKRVVNHLFHQASFYPLNPPSHKISYDAGLAERFATLPIVPNIFIMSSTAKYFTRDVNNCLVINSGQLTDNASRGTFSRLFVKQSNETKVLSNFVGCQIVRI